ncbi:MAG: serine/threonine-protein kinase [Myxococcales bacterium]|nr:serine/threonine protein kinase [Polyangiaceae bacterium]MDW8249115.1 serine/threonine-protein kinase [Myxococcales bacterium]
MTMSTRLSSVSMLSTGAVQGATQVGRYELLMELASGGMATVYIGRQRGAGGFERIVAIKRMHPHISAIPDLAASFTDEARIASLIHHPNVVSVHDVHESEGERLLVMDYVDGVSLAALIKGVRRKGQKIPLSIAIYLTSQALRGLHAAHEQKSLAGVPLDIVHRDATPQNILLGVDGSVRLTDFGIAKAAERSAHTTTGNVKGKFRYMAPEQAMGKPLDRRVDIFALGVVLWEMLSGQRFLKGDTDAEIIHNLAMANFEDLHQVEPTIPPELSAIVMHALAEKPEHRWATAEQFADALDHWARSTGHIATATEVAAFIQEVCNDSIRERRQRLAEILSGQRPPVSLGIPPAPNSLDLATGSNSSIAALSNVGSTIQPAPELPPARSAARWVALAGGAAVLLLIGSLVVLRASSSASAGAAPTTAPAASSVSSPSPSQDRITISLFSQKPITEIKGADAGDILFRNDGASFSLPRGSSPVTITLHFADRTTAEETFIPSGNISRRLVTAGPAPDKTDKNPKTSKKPTNQPTQVRPAEKPTEKAEKNGSSRPVLKSNPYGP